MASNYPQYNGPPPQQQQQRPGFPPQQQQQQQRPPFGNYPPPVNGNMPPQGGFQQQPIQQQQGRPPMPNQGQPNMPPQQFPVQQFQQMSLQRPPNMQPTQQQLQQQMQRPPAGSSQHSSATTSPIQQKKRMYPQQPGYVTTSPPISQPGYPTQQQPIQPGFPPQQQQPGFQPAQPPNFQPGFQQRPPGPNFQQQPLQPAQPPDFNAFSNPTTPAYQQYPEAEKKGGVDPEQVPSPVTVQSADQEIWDKQEFRTDSKSMPPLASSEYLCVDEGNASPRFIRATTYALPCSAELAHDAKFPIGLVIQPLCDVKSFESDIPVVDFGEKGPIRCSRCKAYINPFVKWLQGGYKFQCNLCDFQNDVPQEYFSHMDMTGRRLDLDSRPELKYGVVDFVATKEYCARKPVPASFVFLIDVSLQSIQSGMLQLVCDTLKEMLDLFPVDLNMDEPVTPCRVGIITFDKTVHFYNLNSELMQPQMMVVGDMDELFIPLNEGFLVSPDKSRSQLTSLLEQIPKMFANTHIVESSLGAAVTAALQGLKETGGRLICMETHLPNFGPGMLKNREDPKYLGTEKERSLFSPEGGFYIQLAEKCIESGVGVDLFLFPNSFVDLASVGVLTSLTGGQTFLYPNFHPIRDALKVGEEMRRILTRSFGYDCLGRLRVGNGWKVSEHLGNFNMKNATDIELGFMDSEKGFAVILKNEGKLQDNSEVGIQFAMLYTCPLGRRLIRLINLNLSVTNQLGFVFKFAELDTIVNILAKQATTMTLNMLLKSVRDQLIDQTVQILSAYRKNCAMNSTPGQLILPESFKLFPIYSLCVLKSRAFRQGTDIYTDLRVNEMRMIRSMGVQSSIIYFYPKLYPLINLPADSCEFEPSVNRFVYPPSVRSSSDKLDQNGAFLLENGLVLFLWLGRNVSPRFLQDLFNVSSLEQLDPKMHTLPVLETTLNKKVRMLVLQIQEELRKGFYPQLFLIRQGEMPLEPLFMNLLVEDKNNDQMNYVDYLCFIHKQIQMAISE